MKTRPLVLLCLLSTFLYLITWPAIGQAAAQGPRFTWSAFQRFWEKGATPLVQLRNPRPCPEGYLVDYGYTTILTVHMEKSIVTGVSISLTGGKENEAGGPQFLRLLHHAITVGTFRWPAAEVQKARETFAIMGPAPKDYRYQATLFQRRYDPQGGWTFSFTYVEDQQNPGGRAKLPGE